MRWKTDTIDKAPPTPSVKQRDSKGLFICGNTPTNLQDKTTGKFTTALRVQPIKDRHTIVASEVDRFLDKYQG